MTYEQTVHECVKYKTQAEFYKKLLSETKLSITCFADHNDEAAKHFKPILDILNKNGIKDLYELNFNIGVK